MMLSYILIFSIILIIISINFVSQEGFKASRDKTNMHYRRIHRNVRKKGNDLYVKKTASGKRLMRRLGI